MKRKSKGSKGLVELGGARRETRGSIGKFRDEVLDRATPGLGIE